MKILKIAGFVSAIVITASLCACTSGTPSQTTPIATSLYTAASSAGETTTALANSVINYVRYENKKYNTQALYPDVFGDYTVENDETISFDDKKGADLKLISGTNSDKKNATDLLEENIDRTKNVLADFSEKEYYFYETSDDGINLCRYAIIMPDDTILTFEMTFPSDKRDEYFLIVSDMVKFYELDYNEMMSAK